jgi:UDP-N-acetylglucosamine 4,6-dehydratase/5-epimerase
MKILNNKTLLITGGTGSFGNTILSRVINSEISEVRIFSRDEKKQEEMRNLHNNPKLKFYIGDVRDYSSIRDALKGVDYVFHAAALKQVPSCEFYPLEAIRTNVIGSENLMNASIEMGVKRVVMLSTDKAVYPINAMGISKAMMEKLMVAKSRLQSKNDTIFCATRYGNVMGSRGSVIPLFINQIQSSKKTTITDPKMTRFLMSLEESVDLVLYAFEHGNQGDIFIQKAPASSIENLAKAILEIFKINNNNYLIIGTRHGEKLYESLISREEYCRSIDLGEYYRIPADNRDLNYQEYFNEGEQKVSTSSDLTSHNTTQLTVNEVKTKLLALNCIKDSLDA